MDTPTLTAADVFTLRQPFPADDHEFIRKNAYITETAIVNRIEEVDPAWSFKIISITPRDRKITVHAVMTIKGVTRDNTGMADIEYMKEQPEREANEAEKSATTDALKRCARLFGVGRYLLDLPGSVIDLASLRKYLLEIGNPYQKPDVQTAIRAALKQHNLHENGRYQYVLDTAIPGVVMTKLSDAYPHLLPDQLIARLPVLADELSRKAQPIKNGNGQPKGEASSTDKPFQS